MRSSYILITTSVPVIILSIISLIVHSIIVQPDNNNQQANNSSSTIARIALLNGCGREGLASRFADALRKHGYDVVNGKGDNADSYDFEKSVVIDRKGNMKEAESIAEDIGISTIIQHHTSDPYVIEDFEIILGRDWDTLGLAGEVHQE